MKAGEARTSVFPLDFPVECCKHVLSFLEMKEVLQVAATSVKTMKDTFPSLEERRDRMNKRYVYSPKWSALGFPVSQAVLDVETAQVQFPSVLWTPIPTVAERVSQLYQQIPKSHPLFRLITRLQNELKQSSCWSDAETSTSCETFRDAFTRFQQLTYAQRLHAEILNSAIDSQPLCDDEQGSTSLARYMGDVLCVTYLMNQSHLRIVEGGPSNDSFLRKLRHLPHGSSCYRSWVYIHSSILRRKSFSRRQRDRLGIPEYSGLSEIIPTDLYVNNHFMASVLTLVYSDFGPLGPAFRGRDNVRLADISYQNLFGFWMSTTSTETAASQRVVDLLMTIHEQSRKTRPMTVRPPIVRLTRPTTVTTA